MFIGFHGNNFFLWKNQIQKCCSKKNIERTISIRISVDSFCSENRWPIQSYGVQFAKRIRFTSCMIRISVVQQRPNNNSAGRE